MRPSATACTTRACGLHGAQNLQCAQADDAARAQDPRWAEERGAADAGTTGLIAAANGVAASIACHAHVDTEAACTGGRVGIDCTAPGAVEAAGVSAEGDRGCMGAHLLPVDEGAMQGDQGDVTRSPWPNKLRADLISV